MNGLRQGPKLWYQLFSKFLGENGFRRSKMNDCLFIKKSDTCEVYLLSYVDDLLLFGDESDVQLTKHLLGRRFKITDLGVCQHFLGMKMEYKPSGIFLSQRPFIEKIIGIASLDSG